MLDSETPDRKDLLDPREAFGELGEKWVDHPAENGEVGVGQVAVASEGRLGAAAETEVEHSDRGLQRQQHDRGPTQGLEVERREVWPFAEDRRDLAPGHLTERRDTELGAAAQGRGQLDGAVAGEGVDRRAERRDILAVECLGPVEVVSLDGGHGSVTFWPGIVITMLTRRFLAWLPVELLARSGGTARARLCTAGRVDVRDILQALDHTTAAPRRAASCPGTNRP